MKGPTNNEEQHPAGASAVPGDSYDALLASLRDALDQEAGLSPEQWVAVRQGVDEHASVRPARRGWVLGGLVAVAAAVALVVAFQQAPKTPAIDGGEAVATTLDLPLAAPQLVPSPATIAGEPFEVVSGQTLVAKEAPLSLSAFGRHDVRLSTGAVLDVVRWEAQGMSLALKSGAVTFDVSRDSNEEPFQVTAGGARVTVLGTIFTVAYRGDSAVEVSVAHGRVEVQGADGSKQILTRGKSAVVPTSVVAMAPPTAAPASDVVSPVVAAVEPAPRPVVVASSKTKTTSVRAPASRARRSAKSSAKRTRPAAKRRDTVKVIEIDAGAQRMERNAGGAAIDLKRHLEPIVHAMRGKKCGHALRELTKVKRALAPRTSADITYLSAWCHRQLGNTAKSKALFARYAKQGGKKWAMPKGDDDLPTAPSASRL